MSVRSQENFLIHAMNIGFDKAALSFSQLIKRPVKIVHSQSILIHHKNDFSYVAEEQGELYVLTTHIIGSISGKSFLILSKEECEEIFSALGTSVKNDVLREAFLLEIDNIISASVISELANSLSLEIYGDVPKLYKVDARQIQDFLFHEIKGENSASVIFSNTTFQFDKDKVHPQFIWSLSNKIFEINSFEKISA